MKKRTKSKGRKIGTSIRSDGPVLVVADENSGVLIGRILEAAGHDVMLAHDLDGAMAAVHEARPALSCIVADRDARIGDNVVQLVQKVRALGPEVLADVPVVVLGSSRSKQFLLWHSGIDAYLQRPIQADNMVERIDAAINRHDFDRHELRQAKIEALSTAGAAV